MSLLRVRIPAQLAVSGQMFTGLPMNHSWILATVLLAASGMKNAAKHRNSKRINGLEDAQSSNHKYFYEWNEMHKGNGFLLSMSKIGDQETKGSPLSKRDIIGYNLFEERLKKKKVRKKKKGGSTEVGSTLWKRIIHTVISVMDLMKENTCFCPALSRFSLRAL